MLNRARILVLVLACLVVFGSLYQTYRFDQRVNSDRAAEDHARLQLDAADLALADVRQSQAGYVAAGQSFAFWMTHFDEALARVEGTLQERQQTTQVSGASTHYNTALEQLEALRTSDRRARNYVENSQLFLASDVIFVESQEIIGRIAANVAAARDTEVFAARQSVNTITQYRQGLVGGGLVITLLLGLVASRRPKTTEPVATPEETPATLNLAPEPRPEPRMVAPVMMDGQPSLDEAAEVCVDIARLLDSRDLPSILSRAATAIDAKGLVLWVADESGRTLRASLAHGYPDRVLARLGQLPVSADNVTSLACRTMQPQVVPGSTPGSSGALAVPLIGTNGCVGVLAAEVTASRASEFQVSVARLIAAQLSAVIRPDAAELPSTAVQ